MVGRVILRIIAIFFLVVGVGIAIGGGLLMGFFGSDDTISTGQHTVTTPTNALVGELNDIQGTGTQAFDVKFFDPTMSISATRSDKDLFLGIGPASAVDAYLASAPTEKITRFDLYPYRLDTVRRDGTTRPAPPDQQTFWAARASGANPTLTWKVTDGSYRIVLMNADASPAATANVRASLRIPHLFVTGLIVLIAGIIGVALGVILLVVASRMKAREVAAQAQAYPSQTPAYRSQAQAYPSHTQAYPPQTQAYPPPPQQPPSSEPPPPSPAPPPRSSAPPPHSTPQQPPSSAPPPPSSPQQFGGYEQ